MTVLHRHHDVVVERGRHHAGHLSPARLDPGQLISAVVGLAVFAFGLVAVTMAGLDTTPTTPVVAVAGMRQSAAVGIAEIVLGLLLVATAAATTYRASMAVVGGVIFVAGIVLVAASSSLLSHLGADHDTGWTLMVGGLVAVVAAMMARFMSESDGRPRSPW
jgi:uncharacterized membrane protein YczE